MKVYKVVKKEGDIMTSSVVNTREELCAIYEIGNITVFKHGPGTAFDSIPNAVSFIGSHKALMDWGTTIKILVCDALISDEKIPFLCDLYLPTEKILEFWSIYKREKRFLSNEFDFLPPPKGTIFCDWIIPRYIVPQEELRHYITPLTVRKP